MYKAWSADHIEVSANTAYLAYAGNLEVLDVSAILNEWQYKAALITPALLVILP